MPKGGRISTQFACVVATCGLNAGYIKLCSAGISLKLVANEVPAVILVGAKSSGASRTPRFQGDRSRISPGGLLIAGPVGHSESGLRVVFWPVLRRMER